MSTYTEYLKSLDVEHKWLPGTGVNWCTGEPDKSSLPKSTHCSAFVAAAINRLGVTFPYVTGKNNQILLANYQGRWLANQSDWRQISEAEASIYAQNHIVVASYINSHGPGHIALVLPDGNVINGVNVVQAGRRNFYDKPLLHPSKFLYYYYVPELTPSQVENPLSCEQIQK